MSGQSGALAAATTIVVVAVTFAAPVKADDQSFLNDLAGKNTMFLSPQQLIGMRLTREDFIAMARGYDGAAIFDAAQSQMCPDTWTR